ncbi:MAG: glycerophosphodiester phosphodiesterase [Ideonella sp.]|jgi:glycerophosphoryl diester phosphodiesterase|nr:glycerophosphodiester phosphodiesterase [Ideonella sp.]
MTVCHALEPRIRRRRRPVRRIAIVVLFGLASLGVGAVDLQGHRGARGLAPESTLAGFEVALRLGVTTLEFDTVVTRDGVVIVHHDRRVNPDHTRTSGGSWLEPPGPVIFQSDWADLRNLDVGRARPGSRTAATFPRQGPADGQRIPTLEQVLEQVRALGGDAIRFNIETKLSPVAPGEGPAPETFARLVLDVARRHGVLDRVTIQSFDWRTLQAVQRLAPEVPTAYLTSQQDWGPGVTDGVWTAGLRLADHGSVPRMVKAAGGAIWSPFHGDLTADLVREAQALGLRVAPWTVNEPVHIRRVLDFGVDALITDYPDRARAELAARGLPLPAPLR